MHAKPQRLGIQLQLGVQLECLHTPALDITMLRHSDSHAVACVACNSNHSSAVSICLIAYKPPLQLQG